MIKRRWWMVLSVSTVAAMAAGCQQAPPPQGPPTPIAVYDLPVIRTVLDYEEFPGDVDSPYSVQVRARVSGYMTNVYFTDGLMVKKGDKLFEIDPRMYKADLDRARGTVAQYEAHVDRLKKEYTRAKNLKDRGSISQEEHDHYEADYKESEANLEVARANRDLAQLNMEWTEVTAPIDGLLSRRMVDPGNLIKADDTVLTSVVSLDPLYVYFDVHEQALYRIKRLMQQGKVKLKAQGEKAVPIQFALVDEKDFPHPGVVNFTENRVDLNTGTLRFRAKIENPPDASGNRFIVPGAFVRVRLPIGEPHSALMVREQALVTDQGRKTVFVLQEKKDKDGKPVKNAKGEPLYIATPTDVGEVGVLRDGYREVEKGIKPGDFVVVAGMQRLRKGIDVLAEKMPTAGGKEESASPVAVKEPAGAGTPVGLMAADNHDGPSPPTSIAAAPDRDRTAVAPAAKPAVADESWRTAAPAATGNGGGRSKQASRSPRPGH